MARLSGAEFSEGIGFEQRKQKQEQQGISRGEQGYQKAVQEKRAEQVFKAKLMAACGTVFGRTFRSL